jgi:hypothetical protein
MFRVAYRLATVGIRYCPNRQPLSGLLLHHLAEYEGPTRAAALQRYPLDKGPGVLTVLADSPAARAGLAAGDVLLAVNGEAFADPVAIAAEADAKKRRRRIEASEDQLQSQLAKGPVELTVSRSGTRLSLRLTPIQGCPLRIRLARSGRANAFADGHYVVMTTGLLDLIDNDDELAMAIGHELAHNILQHRLRLEQEDVPTGILRGLGANAAKVKATEEEADRLAVRLAWSAGFDPLAAIPFWRRYYAGHDEGPQLFPTHPGLGRREQLLRATLADLVNEAGNERASPAEATPQINVRSDQSSGKARLPKVD